MLGATFLGVEGRVIAIEAKLTDGSKFFRLDGLSDVAAREARVRVEHVLLNHKSNFRASDGTEIRLSPAVNSFSVGLDLPIALTALGIESSFAAIGELSLNGTVKPVRGILPMVEALKAAGIRTILVAPENGAEAALVEGVRILTVYSLVTAAEVAMAIPEAPAYPSLNDVRGHESIKIALAQAVKTKKGVLLVGPALAGKTMLARRVTGLFPAMTHDEALEVTRIHSVAGLNIGGGLTLTRPFRAPHHSTSPAGMVGGGANDPRPGEVSLAHNGVLFLDEVNEFSRTVIEYLSTVLREGKCTLVRASGSLDYPAKCLVVASALPCSCGRLGNKTLHPQCNCKALTLSRWNTRLNDIARQLDLTRLEMFYEANG